jgi:hypothetical protein
MVCNLGLLVEPRTDGETLSPRLFIPGDEVKGEVVLILTEDENIDTILIDLKGKCKTKIVIGGDRNKQTHRVRTTGFLKFFVLLSRNTPSSSYALLTHPTGAHFTHSALFTPKTP